MKGRWISAILVAALIVLIGLSAYVFLPTSTPAQDQDEPLFITGDWLNYTLSGSNKTGSPIIGNITISISNSSSSGLSYCSEARYSWNNTSIDPFEAFAFQVPSVGQWVKEWRIHTAFGDKFVRTHMDYRVLYGTWDFQKQHVMLVMTSFGVESGLVYQVTVCSPEYRYEIDICNSSSVRFQGLDLNGSEMVSPGLARVLSDNPGRITYGYGSSGTSFGSLEVMADQRLKYEVEGSNVTFYLFSMNNIDSMLGGGQFEFDPIHSMQGGLHGVFDQEIQAGTYWYAFQVGDALENQTIRWYWGDVQPS